MDEAPVAGSSPGVDADVPVDGVAPSLSLSAGRFEALIEHASDLLMVVQPDGRIGYVSPPTRRYVPAGDGPVHALDLVDLLHPEDLAAVARAWDEVRGRPGAVAELRARVRRDDGRLRILSATLRNLATIGTVGASSSTPGTSATSWPSARGTRTTSCATG